MKDEEKMIGDKLRKAQNSYYLSNSRIPELKKKLERIRMKKDLFEKLKSLIPTLNDTSKIDDHLPQEIKGLLKF